jgi:hypothetical protein
MSISNVPSLTVATINHAILLQNNARQSVDWSHERMRTIKNTTARVRAVEGVVSVHITNSPTNDADFAAGLSDSSVLYGDAFWTTCLPATHVPGDAIGDIYLLA